MDIVKKKTKKGFYYKNQKTGNKIKSKKMLKHIHSLRIPPAYHDVTINCDPNAKVLAISTDSMNRKQYIYNPIYIEEQREIKFCDLIHFGRKIKRIRKDIMIFLNKNDSIPSKETVISLILFIIDRCNFRIGNEKYKELYDTYGVSTLNSKHISIKDTSANITFIGKKSVTNKGKITHPVALKLIKKLIELYGRFDYIFYYKDSNSGEIYRITEKHINNYLKKYNKKLIVKMFRTWAANQMVLSELINFPESIEEKELKKNYLKTIKKVAEKMHHTTNVSKKNYVNNELIDFYLYKNGEFQTFINDVKKNNGKLPTTDRILNLLLKKVCKPN